MGFADEQNNPAGDTYNMGSSDGGLVGALIQTGGALYDSYQNRKTSKENTDKTLAANKREAELAYQRDIQQWHMQNAYNDPDAQMQRFRAAGLNPHLIYGNGSASAGNASSAPTYHAPEQKYQYESGNFGQSVATLLPTLMSVGTWLQNMRLSQAELESKTTRTDMTEEMLRYLMQSHPKQLQDLENRLSMFPYQRDTADYLSNQARTKLFEMEQNFRQQYGEGLFSDMGSAWKHGNMPAIEGTKRLEFIEKQAKIHGMGYQNKLLEAKSSWADYNITDPQALMQLVMSGILSQVGIQMRGRQTPKLSTHTPPARRTGELPSRLRYHPSRRVQAGH